jgi:tripartite-type tricarboxylate transporter receptor subunit TctC
MLNDLMDKRIHRVIFNRGLSFMKIKILAAAVLLLFFAVAAATAQQYPNKVVTMVVPFAAGGPTDTVARLIAVPMSKSLGQQVIVENVGGAGGTIAANRVAKATADGYTLLIHHIGQATAPALYRKLPYDALNDFEAIGLINEVPMTLVAKKDFPAKDLKELIAYVKANKEKINLANAGLGAASHLCGMLFMTAIQTDLTTVPYNGTGPAMNDLLGGQVDIMCDQTTNTTSQIKAEKIKVYGVTTRKRVASLPNVPTMDEAGLKGFEVSVWHGLYAPKGTPKPVIDKLTSALHVALKDDNVKQRFAELGTEPVAENRATPAALHAHLKAEIEKWSPIIKKAGVYAD